MRVTKPGNSARCPTVGDVYVLWYGRKHVAAGTVPHHGHVATCVGRVTKGIKNHLMKTSCGSLVVVPSGNIRKIPE